MCVCDIYIYIYVCVPYYIMLYVRVYNMMFHQHSANGDFMLKSFQSSYTIRIADRKGSSMTPRTLRTMLTADRKVRNSCCLNCY